MAKACIYLCHQCFYSDDFGEFGESCYVITTREISC